MEYILENKSILLLSGILALIFVFIKDKWVSNQSVGNEKMANIANNIADGAMSFLKAEYTMFQFQFPCQFTFRQNKYLRFDKLHTFKILKHFVPSLN